MKEELKKNLEMIRKKIDENNIKNQITKTKDGLEKMRRNIDNIIFCRLQKELKKNNQILFNNKSFNYSEEILLMRALTQLNIIPIIESNDSISTKDNNNNEEKEQYFYFLLSKNKAKNFNKKIEPKQFWKNFLKFRDLKSKQKDPSYLKYYLEISLFFYMKY